MVAELLGITDLERLMNQLLHIKLYKPPAPGESIH